MTNILGGSGLGQPYLRLSERHTAVMTKAALQQRQAHATAAQDALHALRRQYTLEQILTAVVAVAEVDEDAHRDFVRTAGERLAAIQWDRAAGR